MWKLALTLLLVTTVGCVDDHPAYHLDYEVLESTIRQTSEAPADLAIAEIDLRLSPDAEHDGSWVWLNVTERFPDGLVRLYEPADNPRLVFDERKPVLAIPAVTVGEAKQVVDEPIVLEIRGRVSNLELEPLCGEPVVFAPWLAVSTHGRDPEPGDEVRALGIRVTAEAEVGCD